MNILCLFDTCGYVFGPAILTTGLSPVPLGLCGALVGLAAWWAAGEPGAPWPALGKGWLAGSVVAALPLAWSLVLLRARGGPAGVASVA